MPSTFTSLHVHVVFSTKDRLNMLQGDMKPRIHAFMGGVLRTLEAVPLEIGGTENHVHLLIGMRSKHCVADLVRECKKASNKWAKELGKPILWQEGYGAFTLGKDGVPALREYIRNQEEHHRLKSFEEEYKELLELAGIRVDEIELFR